MITDLRSAILCDEVGHGPDGRLDLKGVWEGVLYADTRPGLVACYLVLILGLDGAATRFDVRMRGPNLDQRSKTPSGIPAGWGAVSVSMALTVPVFAPGKIMMSVTDRGTGKSWSVPWQIAFAPDAEVLAPDMVEKLKAALDLDDPMTAQLAAGMRTSRQ